MNIQKRKSLKIVPERNDNTSKFLLDFMKEKGVGGKDFNFDQIEHVRCDKHFELKDHFMISKTEEYQQYDIICSACLSDLNRKYDDYLRSKLYSGIITENKEKILQIKEDKVNFEIFTMGKSLDVNTHNDIAVSGDELLNFSHSFDTNVISKFTTCKTTHEEIQKIKDFIMTILKESDEPNLRGIGGNEDLKIRYIKLAYFLLKFNGLRKEEMDYTGLTKNLKAHILEIIRKRRIVNERIDDWLKLVLGEFYTLSQDLENLPYDQEFYDNCLLEARQNTSSSYDEKHYLTEIERYKLINRDLSMENEKLKNVIII